VGQFDVAAAEFIPILSGRRHWAMQNRRNDFKLTYCYISRAVE